MTLHEYLQGMKGKTAAVIGLGVSNRPLVELLARNGVKVIACDRKEREALGGAAAHYEALGAVLHLGEGYLRDLDADVVFRTPGMRPDVPELLEAKAHGAAITSEMEAFFAVCPCPILGVTGSDGKTTTSTITAELLRAQGYTVHLGGNIGTPLFDRIADIRPDDFAVLELSSFQLHSMHCAPDVAIITNISPNQLDVHPDFEDYVSAKCSIYRGQRPDGVLVLNARDAHTPRFAAEAPGSVRYFSSIGPVENGVYCTDGVIYRAHDGKAEKILDAAEIRIPGAHNVENYMAAFAATDGLVGQAACVQVARSFAGVPHRMERIRELNGITFINDSIASSPTRTIAGLHALPKPPVIILGGIYGSIFTPTEAAAVSVFYGLIVGVFIYHEIDLKKMKDILIDSCSTTATVMFITMGATLFGYVLTRARLDLAIESFMMNVTGGSTVVFFMIVNIVLLIAGCFLDSTSALYIFTPLFAPVALQLGIDPIHLGTVMIVNLAIGLFTPPVGVNLYVACGIGDIKIEQITKGIIPCLIAELIVLLLVTYIPGLSTMLVG